METKGVKILKNVKTHWISMLTLAQCVMPKYNLLMKIPIDVPTNDKAKEKFDLLCDVKFDWGLLPLFHCCN